MAQTSLGAFAPPFELGDELDVNAPEVVHEDARVDQTAAANPLATMLGEALADQMRLGCDFGWKVVDHLLLPRFDGESIFQNE